MRRWKLFMPLLGLVVAGVVTGCATVPGGEKRLSTASAGAAQSVEATKFRGYQPIEPLPVDEVTYYDNATREKVTRNWGALTHREKMRLLPNQTSAVSVRDGNKSGSLSYLPVTITAEAGDYVVILDYMKYRVEGLEDEGKYLGDGRVGIGLRVKAIVTTRKAKLNLGDLFGLGLAASQDELSGTLEVNTIGMDAASITDLLPITAKIDQTSIQNTLQSLAAVKAKMWEANTDITPQLISVVQAKDDAAETLKMKGVNKVLQTKTTTPQPQEAQQTGTAAGKRLKDRIVPLKKKLDQ